MKKFFAAVMAAFVLALSGCEKAADEIIGDISETTASETFSETETEASETTAETPAEQSASSQDAAEKCAENFKMKKIYFGVILKNILHKQERKGNNYEHLARHIPQPHYKG